MPPQKKNKFVRKPPLYRHFSPMENFISRSKTINLALDEFEAIRLADYVGMDHEEAAKEMGISRSTFSRLIMRSRKKVALLLIEGRMLSIHGGNIHFGNNLILCNECGNVFDWGFEIGINNCPSCGSSNISNLAKGFGHGKCCRGFNRNRRGKRR